MYRERRQRIADKKGQAAMEFLMTYGWAILAAIIAIGVLAYFGVFNPGRLAGPAGLVSPPFNLDDFNIVDGGIGDDVITMIVTQNLGSSVTLEPVTAIPNVATDGFTVVLPDSTPCVITSATTEISTTTPTPWISGSQVTIVATCPLATGWASGDGVRADLTIRYKKGGTGLLQVSQGNVRGPSQ